MLQNFTFILIDYKNCPENKFSGHDYFISNPGHSAQ